MGAGFEVKACNSCVAYSRAWKESKQQVVEWAMNYRFGLCVLGGLGGGVVGPQVELGVVWKENSI